MVHWTQKDKAYLEEYWGIKSIPAIANQLNRTVNSVKNMAYRLGLGSVLMSGDYITLNQLMRVITGKNVNTYQKKSWIENRGLPIHTKKVNQCSFRVVYIDEFWKWAEKNRTFIDFSKMEPLVLGLEPEWVAEQRKKDCHAFPLQCKTPWTSKDDTYLKDLLKTQKYGYAELSKKLNRSEGAIQRRCCDLGIKYRPVRADNHGDTSKWKECDYKTLADGIKNSDSYAVIGEAIGKSEKAVRGKVYTVYLTENADKVRLMMKDGPWGTGAPDPLVKQAINLSGRKASVKKDLSVFAGLLKYRLNALSYDPYWQRYTCMNWDDFEGCSAGCADCDSCTEFKRIKEQYCARCGCTFYERIENKFCSNCRIARKKQAQKKWRIVRNICLIRQEEK